MKIWYGSYLPNVRRVLKSGSFEKNGSFYVRSGRCQVPHYPQWAVLFPMAVDFFQPAPNSAAKRTLASLEQEVVAEKG
jgi:hypothetical protein